MKSVSAQPVLYDRPVHPADPLPSALAAAVARVGDRWRLLLVDALMDGPRRFGELEQAVPGIAPNTLTQRLRDLESEGLVVGRPYQERPRRLAYELTQDGRDLAGALRALAQWGARLANSEEGPRHTACGTPLEPRWWCPACGEAVEPGEGHTDELRFV
jgi:DNA-binding HxlR family transcriptional regulator